MKYGSVDKTAETQGTKSLAFCLTYGKIIKEFKRWGAYEKYYK
jgi:hypothetical protein